jgi:hypothetical protein
MVQRLLSRNVRPSKALLAHISHYDGNHDVVTAVMEIDGSRPYHPGFMYITRVTGAEREGVPALAAAVVAAAESVAAAATLAIAAQES